LCSGDALSQPEFHRLYELTAHGFKAELLDGVVFVCEPLSADHGIPHTRLNTLLDIYGAETRGVEANNNVTVILGEKDEVQPDLYLRVLPQFNGQSQDTKRNEKTYVKGAPELIAEIAYASHSIDLHLKKQRYAAAGVVEYIVFSIDPAVIHWFDLRAGTLIEPNNEDMFCSSIFPGLWIDRKALLENNYDASMNALRRGLDSPEHANFIAHLKRNKS
jgi:Uma2 family endonuclease